LPGVWEKSTLGQLSRGNLRTFERGMEHETANADEEISKISNGKDRIVAMFPAASDAFPGQVHEEEIGQSINDLG
jgi:hypothetical protein